MHLMEEEEEECLQEIKEGTKKGRAPYNRDGREGGEEEKREEGEEDKEEKDKEDKEESSERSGVGNNTQEGQRASFEWWPFIYFTFTFY